MCSCSEPSLTHYLRDSEVTGKESDSGARDGGGASGMGGGVLGIKYPEVLKFIHKDSIRLFPSAFFFQSTFQLNVSWRRVLLRACTYVCQHDRWGPALRSTKTVARAVSLHNSPFLRQLSVRTYFGSGRCSYETHVPFLGAILNYTSLCADQYLTVTY